MFADPGVDVLDDEFALVMQTFAVGTRVVERHLEAAVLLTHALQARSDALQLAANALTLQPASATLNKPHSTALHQHVQAAAGCDAMVGEKSYLLELDFVLVVQVGKLDPHHHQFLLFL